MHRSHETRIRNIKTTEKKEECPVMRKGKMRGRCHKKEEEERFDEGRRK